MKKKLKVEKHGKGSDSMKSKQIMIISTNEIMKSLNGQSMSNDNE